MKTLLVEYATYHHWAHSKLLAAMEALTETQMHQEIISSFPSISKTLVHVMNAENIWWQRVTFAEKAVVENFSGDFGELQRKILSRSKQLQEWITGLTDQQFNELLTYKNSKQEQFTQPMYEVLLQVFSHGTYHRGQLITMMRQAGAATIPNTDFITWSRSEKEV